MSKQTNPTHSCPCGCGSQIAHDLLSCRPGWFRLPEPLRAEISTAWRKRRQPGELLRHRNAVREALRWYADNPPVVTP